mmetsp:Transcript_59375/g.158036  ORF Transcript_59375/g.158036 Transcript_59375/m.158036 type:complete len:154 (-) Transcript_59375:788-1249(-)
MCTLAHNCSPFGRARLPSTWSCQSPVLGLRSVGGARVENSGVEKVSATGPANDLNLCAYVRLLAAIHLETLVLSHVRKGAATLQGAPSGKRPLESRRRDSLSVTYILERKTTATVEMPSRMFLPCYVVGAMEGTWVQMVLSEPMAWAHVVMSP